MKFIKQLLQAFKDFDVLSTWLWLTGVLGIATALQSDHSFNFVENVFYTTVILIIVSIILIILKYCRKK